MQAYVPPSYSPSQPMPLVLALHGQAGSPAAAATQAQAVRNAWATVAATQGFIVIAPIGAGADGGWVVPDVPDEPSDYSLFAAAIADAEAAWNIDRSRRIGWGFSAGGHVMHDLVLNDYSTQLTIDTFPSYAIARTLGGLACRLVEPQACARAVAARRIRSTSCRTRMLHAQPSPPANASRHGWTIQDLGSRRFCGHTMQRAVRASGRTCVRSALRSYRDSSRVSQAS